MKSRPGILPALMLALGVAASLKIIAAGVSIRADTPADGLHLSVFQPNDDPVLDTAPTQSPALPQIDRSETDRRILEQLAARRSALEVREAALDAREDLIDAAQERLRVNLEMVHAEQAALAALREERDAAADEEIEALINAYERMKARDAAAIFDSLDETILVPVAAGMRTQALAGALAEMQPDNARRLTILLANRASQETDDDTAVTGE